jgi:hypothetical protein
MARTIGALCTFIVCLQILVGVPLAVCVACFCITNGPITVEVHAGHGHAPQFVVHGATIPPPGAPFPGHQYTSAPPPNVIPTTTPTSFDNPILQSRTEHGSPLTGTVLESANPAEEQNTFITALEKAAAEHCSQSRDTVCPAGEVCQAATQPISCDPRCEPAQLIVCLLYEMAQIDEQAADYGRADQWRAFAREIKQGRDRENDRQAAADSSLLPASGESPATSD